MSLRLGPPESARPPEWRDRAFRVGLVNAQDAPNCRVRVTFEEFDHLTSYWLPVVVPKTQNDKVYWMPDVGEQVVCLMDERDENGAVLGAIYSHADAAPTGSADKFHMGFHDGASFEYDRRAHLLQISFSDGAIFKYDAKAHQLSFTGVGGGNVSIVSPAGIVLESGSSQVTILPSGVSITPPLPTSSTVAQT